MPHTIVTIPTVIINDLTPGSTTTFTVSVQADQPASTAAGSVSAEFDGHTETTTLNIQFDTGPVVPVVVVDLGTATNLSASVGTPALRSGFNNLWDVPVTLTVV